MRLLARVSLLQRELRVCSSYGFRARALCEPIAAFAYRRETIGAFLSWSCTGAGEAGDSNFSTILGLGHLTSGQRHSPGLGKSPRHRLARTPPQRHSPPSSGARSRSRLDLFRSPSAVLRGLSSRTVADRDSSQSTGGGTAESISLAPAPADDLWANSPPGSRTNASTPREVSWTDPEAVERRHITLQPTLPKEPSPEQRGDVHV